MYRSSFLSACVLVTTCASSEFYIITPLGGGGQSTGQSINSYGQVVYNSWIQSSAAFLWDPVWGSTFLGTLPGYASSVAEAINRHGVVAGNVWPNEIPFVWSEETGMHSLEMLSKAALRNVLNLNDIGQFVGQTELGLPYVWDETNGLRLTDKFGGAALAVNNDGEVVGWLGSLSARPFKWNPVNGQTQLQMPRVASAASALAINDRGKVLGNASVFQLKGEWSFPCLWDVKGNLQLLANFPPYTRVEAHDINNRSQVVGGTTGHSDAAFIWDAAGGFRKLSQLSSAPGWDLQQATSVNDSGQIVGTGTYAGGRRAFLATPVPFSGMPIDYQVVVGSEIDHDVLRLYESDDDRVEIRSSGIAQMSALVIEACSPWTVPSRLTIVLESSSRSRMRVLRVDIFNPLINEWENLHSGYQPSEDETLRVDITNNPGRYLNPNSRVVKARVLTYATQGSGAGVRAIDLIDVGAVEILP